MPAETGYARRNGASVSRAFRRDKPAGSRGEIMERIWITGIGAATPLGFTYRDIADNLLAGRSGVRTIEQFDASRHTCRFAGVLGTFPTSEEDDATPRTRYEQLLDWCIRQALVDAGLWNERAELRIGIVGGLGAEWLQVWERDWEIGGDLIHRTDVSPSSQLESTRRRLGLSGPVASVGAACASGNVAVTQARRWLRQGWVDVCIAGGFDLPVTPLGLAGFGNLGALSKRNDSPSEASRPFDRDRDGFVISEGGVAFVMENETRARQRGVRAWAEVAGVGAKSDGAHLVIPSSDPVPASTAIRQALRDAGENPAAVDYVNAHATSTPVGDPFEVQALRTVFGASLPEIPVSSTKGASGHLLSAASAFETLACIVALERRAIPPTINLHAVDPACEVHHVPHHAIDRKVRLAVNNSFGFGGSNTCVVLRKVA